MIANAPVSGSVVATERPEAAETVAASGQSWPEPSTTVPSTVRSASRVSAASKTASPSRLTLTVPVTVS